MATRVGWRQLLQEDWNSLTQQWKELMIIKRVLIIIELLIGWEKTLFLTKIGQKMFSNLKVWVSPTALSDLSLDDIVR